MKNFLKNLISPLGRGAGVGLILIILAAAFPTSAQTAWTDSGTVGGDAFIKKITFHGCINGITTDTLYSKAFNLKEFQDRYTFNIFFYPADDSVRITVKRQYRNVHTSGNWVIADTVGIDSILTPTQWIDSLESINTEWRWFFTGTSISGGDINGFNKYFKAAAYFQRKE